MTNRKKKKNAPPRGGHARRSSARVPPRARRAQPTCAFGGRQSLRRSRTTIARAPPNRARRDDRRSSNLLARRRPCIVHSAKGEPPREFVTFVFTFLPRAPATKTIRRPRRCLRKKNFSERASVVSVASSFEPRVRRVFDTCSKSRRTFARRQSARAPGGVARHAAAASSDIALAWGDTRVASGPRRGSGRGARRGEGTCLCRKVSLSIGPTIARVPVSRPRERDG